MSKYKIIDAESRYNSILNQFLLFLNTSWSRFSISKHDVTFLFENIMREFFSKDFTTYCDIGNFLNIIYNDNKLTKSDHAILTKSLICKCIIEKYAEKKITIKCINFDIQLIDRLEVIYRNLNEENDSYFNHVHDKLLKDIGVSCGKMLSARLLVYVPINFPRSYIRHDLRIAPFLLKCGGYTNFLEGHLDETYLAEFSEEGWKRSHMLLAEYIRANPQFKGIANKAWFYDPFLRQISPHLAYLADICLAGGARRFKGVTLQGDIKNALKKSKTRRRLFEEKKYFPRSYWILWPAKALLGWAKRQEEKLCAFGN